MKPNDVATTVILGAGASRSVSYAHQSASPSPLDADFFDLLQRAEPSVDDLSAVQEVLTDVRTLPPDYWRSMERSFYTLQLRAYIAEKLTGIAQSPTDQKVISDFARCVQCLLRKAHGKDTCTYHQELLNRLGRNDTVISFNYDLVAERALRPTAEQRSIEFDRSLYGFGESSRRNLPPILKLHGSSNWRFHTNAQLEVRTKSWDDFDSKPGYRGHVGVGTEFPIFLPFWDKRIEKRPWLDLWKKAYKRLSASQRIIVWGYSLPQTDIKAQHLFDLSLGTRQIDLCVIDPSPVTRERWRRLLPKARYWGYDRIEDFRAQKPPWWN
jgi:hypothetical protein